MELINPAGEPATALPYSPAVVNRETVYCSGQLGMDPSIGELVPGGVEAQARQALENLAALLRAAGSDLSHVVRTGVYLTDMNDFATVNAVYAEAFGGHLPARSAIGVAALPLGAIVEIDCIAVRTD